MFTQETMYSQLPDYILRQMNHSELTKKEERLLIRQKDEGALLRHHMRYFCKMVNQHGSPHVPAEDLIQEAQLAFLEAIRSYDLRRNNRLTGYAKKKVKFAIKNYCSNYGEPCYVPEHARTYQQQLRVLSNQLREELRRSPTKEEIKRTDRFKKIQKTSRLSEDLLLDLWIASQYDKVSLNEPIRSGEDGETVELQDTIPYEHRSIDFVKDDFVSIYELESEEFVAFILNPLTNHERRLFRMMYLKGLTQAEIGRIVGYDSRKVKKNAQKAWDKVHNHILTDPELRQWARGHQIPVDEIPLR